LILFYIQSIPCYSEKHRPQASSAPRYLHCTKTKTLAYSTKAEVDPSINNQRQQKNSQIVFQLCVLHAKV
jgi:hypothetical protein